MSNYRFGSYATRKVPLGGVNQYLYSTQPWAGSTDPITPQAGNQTWGAWAQLSAGFAEPCALYGLWLDQNQGNGYYWAAAVGLGPAGSEVHVAEANGGAQVGTLWVPFPAPIRVPPNTRMAVRVAARYGGSNYRVALGWMIAPELRAD